MRDYRIVGTGGIDHRIRGLGGLPEGPEIDEGTGDRRDPGGGERPGFFRRPREAEDTVAVCKEPRRHCPADIAGRMKICILAPSTGAIPVMELRALVKQ